MSSRSTERRRHPGEFLAEAREMLARRAQRPAVDPDLVEQARAITEDARAVMGEFATEERIDLEQTGEREVALFMALAAAADRRGIRLSGSRLLRIDLRAGGRSGYCDVCDTKAHIFEEMDAQYGDHIYRARVCVRCRKYAPGKPVDGGGAAA